MSYKNLFGKCTEDLQETHVMLTNGQDRFEVLSDIINGKSAELIMGNLIFANNFIQKAKEKLLVLEKLSKELEAPEITGTIPRLRSTLLAQSVSRNRRKLTLILEKLQTLSSKFDLLDKLSLELAVLRGPVRTDFLEHVDFSEPRAELKELLAEAEYKGINTRAIRVAIKVLLAKLCDQRRNLLENLK